MMHESLTFINGAKVVVIGDPLLHDLHNWKEKKVEEYRIESEISGNLIIMRTGNGQCGKRQSLPTETKKCAFETKNVSLKNLNANSVCSKLTGSILEPMS